MRRFKSQNVLRHTIDYSTVLIIEPHFNKISKVLLLFYSLYWPGQMEIFFPFFNQPFSFSSLISHARLPLFLFTLIIWHLSLSSPLILKLRHRRSGVTAVDLSSLHQIDLFPPQGWSQGLELRDAVLLLAACNGFGFQLYCLAGKGFFIVIIFMCV